MFRADLHCHSTCSDGTLSPLELIDLAAEKGLSGLSITDHDTAAAYTDEFFKAAEIKGLKIVTGIEFSTFHIDRSVHILGYDFDPTAAPLLELVRRHKRRREKRLEVMLEKLRAKGFEMEVSDFAGVEGSIGRPHIASLMVERGYVRSIKEAFDYYLGDLRIDTVSVEETIEVIQKSRGKAVIAHPHLVRSNKIIKSLLKLPFDGIECYYGRFDLRQERQWLRIAEEKGWLITGGSDFHGDIRPQSPLGASWVDRENWDKLVSTK